MTATGVNASSQSADVALPAPTEISVLLRSIFESLLVLLLLRAIEQVFFGPGTFSAQAVHPFWIVVLIASVQSGVFAGVFSAGLAVLMMDWPARPIGVDITDYYLSVAIVPAQWLLAALVVGLFRQTQIRAERQLIGDKARLVDANKILAGEVVRLDKLFRDLELEAVTAQERADRLPDALTKTAVLASAAPKEVPGRLVAAGAALGARDVRLIIDGEDRGRDGSKSLPALRQLNALRRNDRPIRELSQAGHAVPLRLDEGEAAICEIGRKSRRDQAAFILVEQEECLPPENALIVAEILARAVTAALTRDAIATTERCDA